MIEYIISYTDGAIDKGEEQTLEQAWCQIDDHIKSAGFIFQEMRCITILDLTHVVASPPSNNKDFKVGDLVYWTDPDDDICSGHYTVQEINNCIIYLANQNGSFVNAFPHELRHV